MCCLSMSCLRDLWFIHLAQWGHLALWSGVGRELEEESEENRLLWDLVWRVGNARDPSESQAAISDVAS